MLAGVLKYGHSGEYAAAAGWYLLLGAGLSVYTLFAAILTVLVHGGTRGDAARKRRFATITLCAGTVVSLALMGWPNYRAAENEKYNEQQEARVLEFVRNSDIVRNMMPQPFDVSMAGGELGRDGRQWRFDVRIPADCRSISEPAVDLRHRRRLESKRPLIRCFTRQGPGERESSYPCRDAITSDEAGP